MPGIGSSSLFALPILLAIAAGPATAESAANSPPKVDPSSNPMTVYPESAQSSGEQGSVVVAVFIGSGGGRPQKCRIDQSSGYNDLDLAAIQSVLNWRFVPAMRNGDSVSDWTDVKVVYNLPPQPAPTNTTGSGLH